MLALSVSGLIVDLVFRNVERGKECLLEHELVERLAWDAPYNRLSIGCY